jgi:hypothetical protein
VFQFGYFRAVTVVARVFDENPPVAGDTGITTATVTITTTNGTVTPLSVVSLVPTSLGQRRHPDGLHPVAGEYRALSRPIRNRAAARGCSSSATSAR